MSDVSVTCPCGAPFTRPIQRGRPAVWCPACREIPMSKRVQNAAASRSASVEAGEDVAESPVVGRYGVEDSLTPAVREMVEARVEEVYAQWPSVWANRESDEQANAWLTNAIREAYV